MTAREAKMLMVHKDDIMFGVIERCNMEMRGAALKGDSGIIFEYPKEYDEYVEMEAFYRSLDVDGYTVVEMPETRPDMHAIGIYWVGI